MWNIPLHSRISRWDRVLAWLIAFTVSFPLVSLALASWFGQFRRRDIMWWLHRRVFVPLEVSIGQTGWDICMAILLVIPPFVVVVVTLTVTGLVQKPVLWTLWRASSRRRTEPLCPVCDYNLTGNVSGICPECGTPVANGHR
jgi:hypothetical protein